MPVAVRNLKTGPTVFSILEGDLKGTQIEWKGKGDPAGEDIQEIPDILLEDIRFRRAMQRGILEQVTREEAAQAILQQGESARSQQEEWAATAAGSIDQQANNDMVTLSCIGPNGRGSGLCGAPVAVREIRQDEAPPLCSPHAHLATEFVQETTGQMIQRGGALVPEIRWIRSTMGRRETQFETGV